MANKKITLKDTVSGDKLLPETLAEMVFTAAGKTVEESLKSIKTYSKATTSTLGLVMIGYSENGKNYPVELDSSGKMFVNVPWTDNNTTYAVFKAATASAAGGTGLVPAPAAGAQTKFLRADGTWQTPANTTYSNMAGATSSAAGKAGLVPAPAAGKQTSFLRGDGTWVVPTNTTYSKATSTTLGLIMIGYAESGKNYPLELDSSGKAFVNVPWTDTNTHFTTKLYAGSGTAANATTTNGNTKLTVVDDSTVRSSITVKGTGATTVVSDAKGVITINSTNTTYSVVGANGTTGLIKNGSAITNASGYTACPIVGGIPYYKDTNTTYKVATTSADGLMSKTDKAKVDKSVGSAEVTTIKKLTQSAYDGLGTKDSKTLYVIVG